MGMRKFLFVSCFGTCHFRGLWLWWWGYSYGVMSKCGGRESVSRCCWLRTHHNRRVYITHLRLFLLLSLQNPYKRPIQKNVLELFLYKEDLKEAFLYMILRHNMDTQGGRSWVEWSGKRKSQKSVEMNREVVLIFFWVLKIIIISGLK